MSSTPTEVGRAAGTSPMALMGGGVPLSLLLDLVLGPRSEELLADERATVPAQRCPED